MSDAADALRLARTEGVGPITFRRLLARFGNATAAIDGLPDIARAAGRRAPLAVPDRRTAEREIAAVEQIGGQILIYGTAGYPPLLATLPDPPPVLAAVGDPAIASRRAVGIVGSRNASANGRRIAEMLAAGLAEAGFAVVSGLARGIDTAAHLGALSRGTTIACIAGGIDTFYPPENAALQRRIGREGVVLAEMPLGTVAQARHFPRRNRVIAGLSLGVVVVEAALKSGSLITARLAAEANREVFAVPGSPLDERCRGTNGLLRDGAHLTETAEDVIALLSGGLAQAPLYAGAEGFADVAPEAELPPGAHAEALQTIVNLLGPSPTAVDDLIRRCQLPASVVNSLLLDLEIAGRIETLSGHRIALIAGWGA